MNPIDIQLYPDLVIVCALELIPFYEQQQSYFGVSTRIVNLHQTQELPLLNKQTLVVFVIDSDNEEDEYRVMSLKHQATKQGITAHLITLESGIDNKSIQNIETQTAHMQGFMAMNKTIASQSELIKSFITIRLMAQSLSCEDSQLEQIKTCLSIPAKGLVEYSNAQGQGAGLLATTQAIGQLLSKDSQSLTDANSLIANITTGKAYPLQTTEINTVHTVLKAYLSSDTPCIITTSTAPEIDDTVHVSIVLMH